MYNQTLRLPHMTPAKLALLNDLFPGLTNLVKIPTFANEDQVRAYVLGDYNQGLFRYEFVSRITDVSLDPDTHMWHVKIVISGD